jgi:hypothetical protein
VVPLECGGLFSGRESHDGEVHSAVAADADHLDTIQSAGTNLGEVRHTSTPMATVRHKIDTLVLSLSRNEAPLPIQHQCTTTPQKWREQRLSLSMTSTPFTAIRVASQQSVWLYSNPCGFIAIRVASQQSVWLHSNPCGFTAIRVAL